MPPKFSINAPLVDVLKKVFRNIKILSFVLPHQNSFVHFCLKIFLETLIHEWNDMMIFSLHILKRKQNGVKTIPFYGQICLCGVTISESAFVPILLPQKFLLTLCVGDNEWGKWRVLTVEWLFGLAENVHILYQLYEKKAVTFLRSYCKQLVDICDHNNRLALGFSWDHSHTP